MKASAAALTSCFLEAMAPRNIQPHHIQLGTQTNAWPIDAARIDTLYAVLDRIRELGFKGFETGFRNFQSVTGSLEPVRARLQSTGLEFFGIHIFLQNYDEKTHVAPETLYAKVAETGSALGAKHLILSGSPCQSEPELANKVAGLNHAGAIALRSGLGLAYHNHAPEFQKGENEIRYLIENTDPKLVSFLVDTGHAFRAGVDVPSFLSANAARVVGVHLRDSKAGREVPLGEGEFPFEAIAAALRNAGWRGWALLEEERVDGSKPGDSAIVPALTALRRAFPS